VLKAHTSVLVPFRDAGDTIDAAVAGLVAREDPALEVLLIDDGSTDSGVARAHVWAQRDPRVQVLANHGRGLVCALQSGLATAQGALIARMDADDICHPERLSAQRAYLLKEPAISVLGTRVSAFTDDGPVGEGLERYVAWQNALVSPEDHRRELFVESPLCHPSIMARREAIQAVGGYRVSAGPEDYELFLRLDQAGFAMAKLPEILLSWRHHARRATFSDARYSLSNLRAAKAPFLAARVAQCAKARRVVWGAGPTGRRLARALAPYGFRPDCFVDVDLAKIGRHAQGVPIVAPTALDQTRDVVIAAVGARGARALIRADLEERGFREGVDAWFAA
jgi:glycosyltransferase involved in cell wall biosynthesis